MLKFRKRCEPKTADHLFYVRIREAEPVIHRDSIGRGIYGHFPRRTILHDCLKQHSSDALSVTASLYEEQGNVRPLIPCGNNSDEFVSGKRSKNSESGNVIIVVY